MHVTAYVKISNNNMHKTVTVRKNGQHCFLASWVDFFEIFFFSLQRTTIAVLQLYWLANIQPILAQYCCLYIGSPIFSQYWDNIVVYILARQYSASIVTMFVCQYIGMPLYNIVPILAQYHIFHWAQCFPSTFFY